jgi:hypothetical protein
MRNTAYTPSEWRKIRAQPLPFLEDAVSSVTPFSGLTPNALAHLRQDWIEWRDRTVHIHIPEEAPCNSSKSLPGSRNDTPPQIVDRSDPCSHCTKSGDTNGFENSWRADTEADPYNVILHKELAAPAVEFLEWIFNTYERPELAVLPHSLTRAANRFIDSSSGGYTKLLLTGPVIYSHYGLSPTDISELSPYTTKRIKRIIQSTPTVDLEKKDTLTFLKTIAENEPVTLSDLADNLNRESNPYKRLSRLEQEGRVKMTGDDTCGLPPATWETTDSWDAPFTCDECEFETYNLRGISSHRTQKHGN